MHPINVIKVLINQLITCPVPLYLTVIQLNLPCTLLVILVKNTTPRHNLFGWDGIDLPPNSQIRNFDSFFGLLDLKIEQSK